MNLISRSFKETIKTGRSIAKNLEKGDIICLYGELGSGKTALTKGIASGLGIKETSVISPTFVLIQEYEGSRMPLYHFDFYRLDKESDILNLGIEEYFFASGVSVIEWADRLKKLLPKEFLKIELEIKGPDKRRLQLTAIGERSRELLEKISEDISH